MSIRMVQGKVVRAQDKTPLRDTLIEVWDRDFLVDDKLGSTRTNEEGEFKISYDTIDAGDTPDLTVRIFRLDHNSDYKRIQDIDGPRDVTDDYDFKEIKIADWEYDSEKRVPLIWSPNDKISSSPQDFECSQTLKLRLAGLEYTIIQKIAESKRTIQAAQEAYPKNYTIKNPELSKSDSFFVNSVLNGFAPALPTRDQNGNFHIRYNLDDYAWDGEHQAPSVHLTLTKNNSDQLVPVEIEYRVREKASRSPKNASFSPWEKASATSGGEAWEKAKCYFRIAEFIDGQVKGHLGRSHLNVGQYAISLYRNIQKSPILKLLHPHLKGVTAINVFGKEKVFGDKGVLALSPLTADSLLDAMRDDLGQCDWKEWSPRAEISATTEHSYAKIQHLYWTVIQSHIEHFFAMHEEKIKLDWKEIYHFSQDLVEHSVAFQKSNLTKGETWYDNNEINTSTNSQKAVSHITKVRKDPTAQDVENLKQACAYAIYHATMWHDWRNDSQAKYGGEIDYARLAIEYSVDDAAFQLFIVNVLSEVKHGYILKNEEGDIPSEFIWLLKRKAQDFKTLGYDLRDLRSRLNI